MKSSEKELRLTHCFKRMFMYIDTFAAFGRWIHWRKMTSFTHIEARQWVKIRTDGRGINNKIQRNRAMKSEARQVRFVCFAAKAKAKGWEKHLFVVCRPDTALCSLTHSHMCVRGAESNLAYLHTPQQQQQQQQQPDPPNHNNNNTRTSKTKQQPSALSIQKQHPTNPTTF